MPGDLHCHTKLSDGSVSLEELVALAKNAGLKTIAVTDHDTLAGAMRAKMLGQRAGINVIPGVEFSCKNPETDRKVHLLCYLPEFPDRLQGLCRDISNRRKVAGQKMAAEVMKRYPLPVGIIKRWIQGSTNIYKQHIMMALMEAGYTTTIYGELYERLFGKDGVAVVKKDFPDVRDVMTQIHEAGGLAVMAHPWLYDSVELIPELAGLGLDGIEVWHDSANEEQTDKLIEIAKKYDLCMTGGSDFHGMMSPKPNPIGSKVVADIFVDRLIAAKKHRLQMMK